MDNNSRFNKTRLVLFVYIIQSILNGFYTLRVQSLITVINSSWFVILPLLFYFYLIFAIIATVGLYYRKKLGLILGYCVLMFGNVIAVVSYSFIYNNQPALEALITPLILVNLCVILYMGLNQSYYLDD